MIPASVLNLNRGILPVPRGIYCTRDSWNSARLLLLQCNGGVHGGTVLAVGTCSRLHVWESQRTPARRSRRKRTAQRSRRKRAPRARKVETEEPPRVPSIDCSARERYDR